MTEQTKHSRSRFILGLGLGFLLGFCVAGFMFHPGSPSCSVTTPDAR